MSKNKNTAPKKVTSSATKIELVADPTAPRREGFSVGDFMSAVKQAENVQMPSRVKLMDYYTNILLDLHLTAVVEKRRNNIKSTQFKFIGDNGKFNEAIDNLMSMPWWRQMLTDLLDARFFGYTVSWLDLSGGQFHKYKMLPRKHIIPQKSLFVTKQTDNAGIDYNQGLYPNFIVTAGETDDLGFFVKAIPWVLFKRGDISDWATFNELYALPFRKGKYPQYDEVAKKALAEACREAGSNGFAIIPDTTELEFVQSQASASTTAYERFASFCDKQISKGGLTNTMTLDAEGGNYKGDVHLESERGVYAADRAFVLDILNTKILELLELHGFNAGKGYFAIIEEDHICLKDRILIDVAAAKQVIIPPAYWYEKYGYPIPDGGPQAFVNPLTQLVAKHNGELRAMSDQFRQLQTQLDERPIDAAKPIGFFD